MISFVCLFIHSFIYLFILRHRIEEYGEQGLDFMSHLYIAEVQANGFPYQTKEYHGHLSSGAP